MESMAPCPGKKTVETNQGFGDKAPLLAVHHQLVMFAPRVWVMCTGANPINHTSLTLFPCQEKWAGSRIGACKYFPHICRLVEFPDATLKDVSDLVTGG